LLYSDVTELINTEYNDMVSYSYTRWKDVVIEYYHEMQKIAEELKGQTIVAHRQLSEDVSLTVYDSGKGVIVNYTEKPYQYQDCVIEGRGYLLVEGVK